MQLSLKMGLGGSRVRKTKQFDAFAALGARDGFAIDFTQNRMVVNDAGNPSNVFDGDPKAKLTVYGADPWVVDTGGLDLSATRDFAVAMATNAFPYDPTALHIYARFTLNDADSVDQRYLFMVDNSGNDRFAMFTTSGVGFRWVTSDGASADTEVSSLALTADTEYRTFFGADAYGRSWVDDGGVQTTDQLHLLSAATPSHVGLGGYPNQVLRVLDGHLAEIAVICGDVILDRRQTLEPLVPYYAAEGDSHTFNVSFGMVSAEFYPALVGAGEGIVARNFGASGESSAQMLAAVDDLFVEDVPSIASIYAGSNDEVTQIVASPTPTADSFDVSDASKLAVGGWVKVNSEIRKVASLTGTSVVLEMPLTIIPIAGDDLAVDTFTNISKWIEAVKVKGVARVVVIGSHYLNFASGGDTVNSEQSLRASVRVVQRAAANAEGAEYVDTYAHMRALILAGGVVQGDWAVWHQGATNTHLTPGGEVVLADAIRAALF
ncbi:hypothetical protein A9Q96_15965 [Rhodobacterales bacterium 52_120_T64]|nr:hypothetical protein A9Q96_15965 [Rhodobacterales bacterium 52_120_T64]